jgi:hypothetical protein
MSTLDLVFDGKTFPVLKKTVFELLEHQELFHAASYRVQSSVPPSDFEAFVGSLKTQTKITVTKGNAVSLSFLAKEFFLSDLSALCATFSVPVDQFLSLYERVLELERQMSASFSNRPDEIGDQIESQEQGLENLRLAVEKLQTSVERGLTTPTAAPKPSPFLSPKSQNVQTRVEIPMKSPNSLDGIISYLTKKHGGNVHEKGIVSITSKSLGDSQSAPADVADLTSDHRFRSKDGPGQWICWNFHEMRLCPTDYTMRASQPRSWVVEGALDDGKWTEIDRQTDTPGFYRSGSPIASFAVSKPAEFRLIRLTLTDKRYTGDRCLILHAVEFFGSLSE